MRRLALPASILLISAAALAYQLLLMQLLAIAHWYPFAAMIVSLALLGHGVSGTVLAFAAPWAKRHFHASYLACALAFVASAPLCWALAQRLPFNGLALVWDMAQVGWLSALYALLSLPFFFAATCFGLAFVARGERIPRLYAADLIGAGLGGVAVIALLWWLPLPRVLPAIAGLGLLGAALAMLDAQRPRLALGALLAGALALWLLPAGWIAPRMNDYKALPRTLLLPGAQVVAERSSPYGWLHVVESPRVPLRHVPGLSLLAGQEPAPQLGLFTDGDAMSAITAPGDEPDDLDYLGRTTGALAHALRESPRVLVLGAGGGSAVRQALTLDAEAVTAVELDPFKLELVGETFADFAGGLYGDPRVATRRGEARSFLRGAGDAFDLIVLPLADSAVGAGAGVQAAGDAFLYTVEAFGDAYARLADDGLLTITRWETVPPRDSLKLFATAVVALRNAGIREPGAQLVLIRSWEANTLLLRRGAFTPDEIARVQAFCDANGFDVVWAPGVETTAAEGFHDAAPTLHEGVRALLGDAPARYLADYKFDIAPATDARPFFHHFFRWRTLPELWRLREQGAAVLLDSGYLVLAAALAQALPLSTGLILLPLLALRRRADGAARKGRAALYFLCLGLGFLAVEIAALSRFTLFIGHPLWAATTVLAALLAFAGLGSGYAQRLSRRDRPPLARSAALVAALLLLYEALLPGLFLLAAELPVPAKALLSAAALAPLAFCMGLPFPLGLSQLSKHSPALVPWAWGINGCASVLSALLAVLLAIEVGYAAVVWLAAILYAIAAVAAWTPRHLGARGAGSSRQAFR